MYNTFIFLPLYNGLVALMNIPGIDVGLAVILFTAIVRLILYPLSKSALLTQVRMKDAEPELNKIKAQHADNRQMQAQKTMELYKTKKIKPLSGVLLIIIQLPILIALISVFYKIVPTVQPELLYSFVHVPTAHISLLGINLLGKSLILALLTGVIQFFQLHYSLASHQIRLIAKKNAQDGNTVAKTGSTADMMSSMNTNMKYFMPILAFASVYWLIPARYPQAASIIAIYWSVSTLFTLGQELYVRKKLLKI
ncbi:MAG: membrane protein insertase YidC [Candidatus Taylorbacteria bacterium]